MCLYMCAGDRRNRANNPFTPAVRVLIVLCGGEMRRVAPFSCTTHDNQIYSSLTSGMSQLPWLGNHEFNGHPLVKGNTMEHHGYPSWDGVEHVWH